MPRPSPDGRSIAFYTHTHSESLTVISTIDLTTGKVSTLTKPAHLTGGPAWSPDGSQIAFSQADAIGRLLIMNSDGSNLRSPFGSDIDYAGTPAWSPDGTQIAFAGHRASDPVGCLSLQLCTPDIYVSNPDGTGLRQLTNTPEAEGAPAWSPDGTSIAFQRSIRGDSWDLYVMDADGGNQRAIVTGPDADTGPAWGQTNVTR